MPSRTWNIVLAVLTIVVGLALFLFWTLAIWDISSEHTRSAIQAETTSDKYKYKTDREIQGACAYSATVEEKVQCLVSAMESQREAERAEKDLKAQENMASWAFWMTIATALQVLISFAGIIYIARTFQKTGESVALTNKAIVIENRPWIKLEPHIAGDLRFDKNRGTASIPCKVAYKNVGNSPAQSVTIVSGEVDFGSPTIHLDVERWVSGQVDQYRAQEIKNETIFPEEVHVEEVWPRFSKEIMDRHPEIDGKKAVAPVVIFCALYQSSIDDTVFHTVAAYCLFKVSERNTMQVIFVESDTIGGKGLDLSLYPGTSHAT